MCTCKMESNCINKMVKSLLTPYSGRALAPTGDRTPNSGFKDPRDSHFTIRAHPHRDLNPYEMKDMHNGECLSINQCKKSKT